MPKNTGLKTKAGRPLFEVTEPEYFGMKQGDKFSERTATIPLKVDPDTGEPMPGTKWVNVPTVFENGKIINDEDFLMKFYKQNNYVDPLTNEKLKFHGSLESAIDAAKQRSSELID
jgi:hypothetical protein